MERAGITILYASQTGSCLETSDRLGRLLTRNHFKVNCIKSLDCYKREDLVDEDIVIFICSTTGEGDLPDTMKSFWQFLMRKSLPKDILSNLKFAVFGQGDSSYQKFNVVGKKLFKRLSMLGADPICNRGDGDDQHWLGIDGAFIPFSEALIEGLYWLFPSLKGLESIPFDTTPEPEFKFELVEEGLNGNRNKLNESDMNDGWYNYEVIKNERITGLDHFQDTRHLVFKPIEKDNSIIPGFEPGDVAMVMPKNDQDDVNNFLELMGWMDLKYNVYQILPNNKAHNMPLHLHHPIQLNTLLLNYLNITHIPNYTTFFYLYHFVTNPLEKEKLHFFLTTSDGLTDRFEYVNKPRRTLLETIDDFKSFDMPLNYLLDMVPIIRERKFSIANNKSNGDIELMVGIVDYKTVMAKPRKGLATSYIKNQLFINTQLKIKTTKSTMTLPKDPTVPILMIGPGLGVAPFRSFIQQRVDGNNWLIFGCRNKSKDEYFKEEWERLVNEGKIWYRCAASRDQPKKIYVQDIITNNQSEIIDLLLNQKAYIYVCGSSGQMPKSVRSALIQCMAAGLEGRLDEAELLMDKLEKTGRYQAETW